MSWLSLVTACLLLGIVRCDYACLCSYNEEINVYDKPDTTGNVLGQMYEFDCKPDAKMTAPQSWGTVMFQHQLGYIQMNSDINNQSCQGDIPDEDKLNSMMSGTTTVAMTTTTTVIDSTVAPTTPGMTTMMPTQTTTTTPMESTTTMPPQTKAPTTPGMTTMMPTQTTTTTMQPQTQSTTTSMPGTGRPFITGRIDLCPSRIQQLASKSGVVLGQFGDNCYEVVQNGISWSHAELKCKQSGGHLAHIANEAEQRFIHGFLVQEHSHTVWLGLHDRKSEEHFEWTSGNAVNYTNWTPGRKSLINHRFEDCVYMKVDGTWDDIQCGGDSPIQEIIQGHRHAYICQFATTNAAPLDGDLSKCSAYLQHQSVNDGGILAQHENSCYELVYHKTSWYTAENMCQRRKGHLATITNAEEQSFVMDFMNRHSANHAVWIGLNDKNSEGTFHWSSGDPAQFINWVPNHQDNYNYHSREDCVLFVPYENGQWDDVVCGSTGLFGDSGEIHPYLCRFDLQAAPVGPVIG